MLVMTGANSAVGLRSMPVRYLFLDEVDGYPLDVEGEGDAISLAEARTRTFARRKIFIVSTPTISGASAIEREFEASDQRRLFCALPALLAPAVAALRATALGQGATGHRRLPLRILRHRHPRASQELDAGARRVAGHDGWLRQNGRFHLSSLYSPVGWRSWRDIAAAWEAAVSKESGSAAAIKTFKNTELGETWVEEGEAPDWQRWSSAARITASAACRKAGCCCWWRGRRTEGSYRGIGMGVRARQGVVAGRASRADGRYRPRRGVEAACRFDRRTTGRTLQARPCRLARFALDTGFATQDAYAFVRACRDPRVMAVKGWHVVQP